MINRYLIIFALTTARPAVVCSLAAAAECELWMLGRCCNAFRALHKHWGSHWMLVLMICIGCIGHLHEQQGLYKRWHITSGLYCHRTMLAIVRSLSTRSDALLPDHLANAAVMYSQNLFILYDKRGSHVCWMFMTVPMYNIDSFFTSSFPLMSIMSFL